MKKSTPVTISNEILLEYLHLPTIDDTQTAFAKSDICISESTAAKWRKLAREDSIETVQANLPLEQPEPSVSGTWTLLCIPCGREN